jgi:hypothetical protein
MYSREGLHLCQPHIFNIYRKNYCNKFKHNALFPNLVKSSFSSQKLSPDFSQESNLFQKLKLSMQIQQILTSMTPLAYITTMWPVGLFGFLISCQSDPKSLFCVKLTMSCFIYIETQNTIK